MNIEKYLNDLYKTNTIKPVLTDLGLSNEIYYFEFDNQKYALRYLINNATTPHINIERQVQIKAKDMDFEEVYYDNKNNIRITKWIDNLKTFSQYNNDDKFSKTIKRIKQFHKLDIKTNINFDLKAKYNHFIKNIKKSLYDYRKYENIIDEYSNLKIPIVLSHNDLVDGNICFKDKKCFLIDYEYASNNYEYFDLVSLLSENKIYDNTLRNNIYSLYFDDKINDDILYKCLYIEICQDLLWAAWANQEYDNKNKDIYLDIFKDKIDRFNKLIVKL